MAEQRGSGWWVQLKGEVDPFERWQVGGMERERGIQSGVEGIRRWGLVPLLESKDLFSINKVAV